MFFPYQLKKTLLRIINLPEVPLLLPTNTLWSGSGSAARTAVQMTRSSDTMPADQGLSGQLMVTGGHHPHPYRPLGGQCNGHLGSGPVHHGLLVKAHLSSWLQCPVWSDRLTDHCPAEFTYNLSRLLDLYRKRYDSCYILFFYCDGQLS